MALDHWIAAILAPLACWVILNGLDDLLIDVAALSAAILRRSSAKAEDRTPTEEELDAVSERRIAVFVALWREHRVIRKMIENNAARLRYSSFDFFIGTYPNDPPTVNAVREAMKLFPNVHIAVCPHDGPTSKADCLNWIYHRMLLFEEQHGVTFEMVVIHDAEDLIDPDALRWINYYAQWNDMVQIPVLAWKTPAREILHGIYCDEFAEFQFKDMQARSLMKGFIPSSGVGTGFSRRALESLAQRNRNRIFEPQCLTEDYEIGFRIHALGLRQKFIPIHIRRGRPIATREYFPRTFAAAVRQRSRWVMGIALQSWEFHTRQETLRYMYWFWRDRKGLAANLITPLANLLFLYGGLTWLLASTSNRPWGLAKQAGMGIELSIVGMMLQILHTSIRAWCSAQVYGWNFAAVAPVRVLAANWLNFFATARAIRTYTVSKLAGRPLRWAKTDHLYPSRAALIKDGRPLGEILVSLQLITPEELEVACATQPPGVRIGEHLIALGFVDEAEVYGALARYHGLVFGRPEQRQVSKDITRSVPAAVAQRWRVLPFRVFCGELHIATADLPAEEAEQEIRRFTSLEVRFQIVTPADFRTLASQYLPKLD